MKEIQESPLEEGVFRKGVADSTYKELGYAPYIT